MSMLKLGTDGVDSAYALLYTLEVYGGTLPKSPADYLCFHGIMFGFKVLHRIERYLDVFI